MKIAVICANGKAGKLIVKEAAERGLDVTAVVRGENHTVATQVIKKDLFDLTTSDLEDFDVKWTYVSPAGDFQAEGARTGDYILGGEELTLNSKGQSVISYADYAIAMVDEAVKGNHIQKRISVVVK